MWDLQRAGLQELPAQGVAGGWWLWDGASTGAAQRRHRPHVLERLRVGIRHRAHGDAQARRRRHPPVLRIRPALLGAVLASEGAIELSTIGAGANALEALHDNRGRGTG